MNGVDWAALVLVAYLQMDLEEQNALDYERVPVPNRPDYRMVVPYEPAYLSPTSDCVPTAERLEVEDAQMILKRWFYTTNTLTLVFGIRIGVFHKCRKVAYNIQPPYVW